jgi:hypothetical protein
MRKLQVLGALSKAAANKFALFNNADITARFMLSESLSTNAKSLENGYIQNLHLTKSNNMSKLQTSPKE